MKKVFIIQGSYKEKGMTASLVESFTLGLKDSGGDTEIEICDLKKKKIEYCNGCEQCHNTGTDLGICPIVDDTREILEKMISCNCLVYATPVYVLGPTALLKKFMERNIPILKIGDGIPRGRLPRKKDKYGVILLSTGAPYPFNEIFGMNRYPKRILKFLCSLWSCGKVFTLPAGGMEKEGVGIKWRKKSHDLGFKIGKLLKKS
jgi:multimeric flavodoxin WrbA